MMFASDPIARLTPFERWMVRSNLETVQETGTTYAEQAAQLRANGYGTVANAVEWLATEPVASA
jgi:hypothetical protein